MFCIASDAIYKYNYNNKNKYKNNIKYRYNQVQGFWAVYPPGILTFLSKNEKLCEIYVEGGVENADKTGHRRRSPLQ